MKIHPTLENKVLFYIIKWQKYFNVIKYLSQKKNHGPHSARAVATVNSDYDFPSHPQRVLQPVINKSELLTGSDLKTYLILITE